MTNLDHRYPAGYDDAIAQAVRCAARHPVSDYRNGCYWVYQDGQTMFVRHSSDPKPEGAVGVCIAQRWDEQRVQLRFTGARSEWRNV